MRPASRSLNQERDHGEGGEGNQSSLPSPKGYHIARSIIRNAHHAHNSNALVEAGGLARSPLPLSSQPADRLALRLDVERMSQGSPSSGSGRQALVRSPLS